MRLTAFFLTALFILSGCGYKVVTDRDGKLPAELTSMSIPLAKNRTMEPALEDHFTEALVQRFAADGRVKLLPPGQGEAELRCILQEFNSGVAAYSQFGRATVLTAVMRTDCALVIPGSEAIVWKKNQLSSREEYPASDNPLADEQARAAAIHQLCARQAEEIKSLLLNRF